MNMKNILLVLLALVTVANTVPEASGQAKLVMKVNIASDANNDNPVAFDLVLVTDKMLLEELGKISASEWFENRNQYRLDYPEETGLSAGSWEWVPGQVVALEPITVKREIVGGVIFAHYFTPGEHRAVIDPRKSFTVTLGAEGFTITPEK
jgi:type VI secretion system protein